MPPRQPTPTPVDAIATSSPPPPATAAETGIVQTTVSVLEMNTYYVAPVADGGSPINPGTLAAPMALPTAFADARAGDTIIMMGGTYGILADLSNGYGSVSALNHGGLPGAPLTIENYPGQQPVVDLGGYYPLGAGGWQQDPATGYWHVTLPSNSIAGGSPLGPSTPTTGRPCRSSAATPRRRFR